MAFEIADSIPNALLDCAVDAIAKGAGLSSRQFRRVNRLVGVLRVVGWVVRRFFSVVAVIGGRVVSGLVCRFSGVDDVVNGVMLNQFAERVEMNGVTFGAFAEIAVSCSGIATVFLAVW